MDLNTFCSLDAYIKYIIYVSVVALKDTRYYAKGLFIFILENGTL